MKVNPDPTKGTKFSWTDDGPVRTVDKFDKRAGLVYYTSDNVKRKIFIEHWDHVFVRDK